MATAFILVVSQLSTKMKNNETRGMLTTADKAWLREEIEYKHRQSEAQRRQEIRERVTAALQDFALLIEHWPAAERQKVFEEIDQEEAPADVIEFLYLGLNELAYDAERMVDEDGVDLALAFRRALSDGIQSGKEHFGDAPNTVLIDSNAELFEVPSVESLQHAIDTDQWRDANSFVRGTFNESDDTVIEKEEAAKQFHMELHLSIERELYSRRKRAESDVSRHDSLIGSTGLLSENWDS